MGSYLKDRLLRKDNPKEYYKRYYKIVDSGCWEWLGALNVQGYGHVNTVGLPDNTPSLGYKLLFELHKKKVPNGLELDHLCKNRLCVNPDHLEIVTHYTNMQRSSQRKITMEAAIGIRKMYKSGKYTMKQLEACTILSDSCISEIIHNKAWYDPNYTYMKIFKLGG